MLALTDAAFAHLAIAASAIAPEQRKQWLRDLADRVNPPPVSRPKMAPAAIRQRKLRANRKAGKHCYTMWITATRKVARNVTEIRFCAIISAVGRRVYCAGHAAPRRAVVMKSWTE